MLSPLEERLADVPRWTIVRTLRRQSVAEHSFNVALIADWLCDQINPHYNPAFKYEVMRAALLHDRKEALSGDVASPAKKFFDDEALDEHYSDKHERDAEMAQPEAMVIVKLADKIEACVFLQIEMNMGNKSVRSIHGSIWGKVAPLCYKLGGTDFVKRIHAEMRRFDEPQDPLE